MRSPCSACELKQHGTPASPTVAQLRHEKPPLSGIFNLNKPAGMTSHDVVQAIRRASDERRVGHAGTLDPMATGVLLVCVGNATRVTEYLMEQPKQYRAEITLGITTDTLDAEGKVTHVADVVDVSRQDVEEVVASFTGAIKQVPPMYSAVKKAGKKLYELAREGITIEREPREVEIRRLEITAWEPPRFTVDMECSKGTYVRALARDLGDMLGIGAHLSDLTRTASGRFTVEDANDLDTVIEALADEWWMFLIHPLDEALLEYEAIIVDVSAEERICHGRTIDAPPSVTTQFARAYSQDGRFIAVMRYEEWDQKWQPHKVFAQAG
ncbi:MAG: tRNA pseudouridine(55) synthase TruB [Anaerolineae bacterium]